MIIDDQISFVRDLGWPHSLAYPLIVIMHSVPRISQLSVVTEDASFQSVDGLESIFPRFFVAPLQDKPQNPIMDTLRVLSAKHRAYPVLPPELRVVTEDVVEPISDVWVQARSRLGIKKAVSAF
jgi:hypothetical protein